MGQSNQEPLVNFDQAKALKAVGFNWPTEYAFTHWNSPASDGVEGKMNWNAMTYEFWGKRMPYTSAPTISQAIRFFRIEKGIPCGVTINVNELKFTGDYMYDVVKPNGKVQSVGGFDTHDLAASALLDKLIELTAPPSVTNNKKTK